MGEQVPQMSTMERETSLPMATQVVLTIRLATGEAFSYTLAASEHKLDQPLTINLETDITDPPFEYLERLPITVVPSSYVNGFRLLVKNIKHWTWQRITPESSPHLPRRGSEVEAYIKAFRDRYIGVKGPLDPWNLLDNLLDDYRLRADTGLTLDRPIEEAGE